MNVRKLREELKERQMSLRAYAQHLGINVATLYRKLAGQSEFLLPEIRKTSELFGFKTTEAIFFDNEVTERQRKGQ